jgi:hypothetical protein
VYIITYLWIDYATEPLEPLEPLEPTEPLEPMMQSPVVAAQGNDAEATTLHHCTCHVRTDSLTPRRRDPRWSRRATLTTTSRHAAAHEDVACECSMMTASRYCALRTLRYARCATQRYAALRRYATHARMQLAQAARAMGAHACCAMHARALRYARTKFMQLPWSMTLNMYKYIYISNLNKVYDIIFI